MLDGKGNGRLGLAVGALLAAVAAAALLAGDVLASPASASAPGLVVSLTFDDGYANQYTTAAPILEAHGMQGTFFVPSGFVGSSGYMDWSQVSALAAAGNEIGGHTIHHVDLTSVSAAQARQEICADRDALLQHGLTITDFAYPYGTSNAGVESIAQECGYNSARTTSWYGSSCGTPCTESIPPRDPYATTIVAFGGSQTLAAIEANITTAETTGGWAQILIHSVCDDCGSTAMSPEDLSALLDWLQPRAAQGTVVETVAQVIGGPTQPPVDPNAAVPSVPTLNGATGAAGSVALQWSAPYSDGGSAITGYNIYRGTASGAETLLTRVGNTTGYTDTSVANGTAYYYRVSAVNAVGESVLSNEAVAITGAWSVLASDQFDRTVASGFGTPDVGPAWSVSSAKQTTVANGEGVIYGWTSGNKDIQAWIPATASDMDILARVRLSAQNPTGANYQARVTARAQADTRNGYTAVITHTTTGALRWSLNRVVKAGGTGTLTLGNGTLLSSGAAGTKWWIRLDVQGSQIRARFWQDGTTEPSTWRISATDSQWTSGFPGLGVYVGSGLTSPYPDTGFADYTATALDVAPAVPSAPTLNSATGGDGSVTLQWSAPSSDGGSAITGYGIYRGTASGGETLLTQVGNTTGYTDTSVTNGAPYYYKVSARNAVGESGLSNERSATPGAVPSAPTLSSATGGDKSVVLQWSAPSSDGGSAITGYTIYRGAASGGETLLTQIGNTTGYTDTSVTNGTSYYYRVSAVSAVGESALSNELSATPRAAPSAPTLNSTTGGDGSVALQWSAPSSDGGSAITGYNIYRGTASGAETLLTRVGNTTSYTDISVTNGTSYYYRVSAVNTVGESALSNERSATPGQSSVIVSDQFGRTVASGFGIPDVGPAWSVSSTKQTMVANGEGVIYGWTVGNRDIQAWIPTTASDMDIVGRVRLSAQNPTGANYQPRLIARAQADARNGYTAAITHTTAGAVRWSLNRVVNAGGTGTLTLGSGTLLSSGAAGTKWWIRLDVQGSQIKARFWQDGTTEPSTWRVSATDSQWTSGFPGLGVYVGSGLTSPYPDTGFNSYTATALP